MATKKQARTAAALVAGAAGAYGVYHLATAEPQYETPAARIEAECGMADPDGVMEGETGITSEEIRDALADKPFARKPRRETRRMGRCMEALRADDGKITEGEGKLLKIWAENYIEHLVSLMVADGKLDLEDGDLDDMKYFLTELAGYLIDVLADSPNMENRLEALDRLYGATHRTWILGRDGAEFDPDEFERPGSVYASDAGILSRLIADLIIHIQENTVKLFEDPEEAEKMYESTMTRFEEALRNVGFMFDPSKHAAAAEYLRLKGLKLGSMETDSRSQLFEAMARYRWGGDTAPGELEDREPEVEIPEDESMWQGGWRKLKDAAILAAELAALGWEKGAELWEVKDEIWEKIRDAKFDEVSEATKHTIAQALFARTSYEEVLAGLAERHPDTLGKFFDEMVDMEDPAAYFEEYVLKNNAVMNDDASEIWDLPVDKFNEYLTVETTLWILDLTPETIVAFIEDYKSNRAALEQPLTGEGIAKKTWGKDPEAIHDGMQRWVEKNLGESFRGKLPHEEGAWHDEGAATAAVFVPYAGIPAQIGASVHDWRMLAENSEGLGKIEMAEATAVTAAHTAGEGARTWIATSAFAAKGVPFPAPPTWVVPVWMAYEAGTLWFDPQYDPDRGWTDRFDRNEGFADSLIEKFRILLLGLIGFAYIKRDKIKKFGYKKRAAVAAIPMVYAADELVNLGGKVLKIIRSTGMSIREYFAEEEGEGYLGDMSWFDAYEGTLFPDGIPEYEVGDSEDPEDEPEASWEEGVFRRQPEEVIDELVGLLRPRWVDNYQPEEDQLDTDLDDEPEVVPEATPEVAVEPEVAPDLEEALREPRKPRKYSWETE
ncbi:hypothetical protein HOG48_01905 [Candidatus Peregrinibacteria bacterium]|nr:hypothetical protein [Candidatus Peregrinibacteria bacterium]